MSRQAVTVKKRSSRFKIVGDVIAELRKVVWLSRREAAYLTLIVIIVTIVAAAGLGLIDYGFTRMVDQVFLGG
jgi:preprotein translocase SecE subunit